MSAPHQPDIVCLSANDWTGLPTSKQHLMSVLSRTGRVLYVDPPLDLASVLGRPRRWAKLRRLRRPHDGPWVLSPVRLAHSSAPDARAAFFRHAAPRVRSAARRIGIHDPVVWAFAPEHVACAGLLGEALLVYHAADDPSAMSRHPTETAALEGRMLAAADLVFVSSQALLDARARSGNVHRLPNAADRAHYSRILCGDPAAPVEALLAAAARPRQRPPELRGVDRPVLLYGGAVYGWFDEGLLLSLAAARPEWLFVLVGPVAGALRSAALPSNVLSVGRKPYAEFPWYVAAADVAIMPWRDGAITRHADPIMLYEYLLCGKPVVATPFPAALERGPFVRTASGPEAFAVAVEEALAEPRDSAQAAARARFGFSNTWEDRAARALSLIAAALRAGPRTPGGGA
jgi:glycosyltransferase involved in cell wall biosynthesis